MSASTLLLRLSAPMQSWGTQSHFTRRDTGLEPSKSGVIGLLCAALGRPREAPVADLAALRMGVRVDREGIVQVDYQTAGGNGPGKGSGQMEETAYGVAEFSGGVRTVVSRRAYLANANFLVGLEASTPDEERLLRLLDAALAHPVWPLFLGRKSFPPAEPIRLPDAPPLGPGLRPLPLREALLQYPWPATTGVVSDDAAAGPEGLEEAEVAATMAADTGAGIAAGMDAGRGSSGARGGDVGPGGARQQGLRFVFEDPSALSGEGSEGGEARQDTPVSFATLDRRYAPRFVRIEFHTRPETTPVRTEPE